MSHYCSPLRYPGGKNCIYNFVSSLFFENDLIGVDYAEPYAGGAGLALRLLFNEFINCAYINDLDRSIYAFWVAATEESDRFCSWITDVEVTIDSWYHYKEIQRNSDKADLFDLAKSTFFLNRTNVSGVIKGGVIGGYQQVGKYKIDARFNKDDLLKRFQRISQFKDRIVVSSLDGLEFVSKMNRKEEEVFIYLDPPYFHKGASLYMNYYSKEDHSNLSQKVLGMGKMWMTSYDNQEFILNLYSKRRRILYKLSQSASNRVGDEVIIFSDRVEFNKSIKELSSPTLL